MVHLRGTRDRGKNTTAKTLRYMLHRVALTHLSKDFPERNERWVVLIKRQRKSPPPVIKKFTKQQIFVKIITLTSYTKSYDLNTSMSRI